MCILLAALCLHMLGLGLHYHAQPRKKVACSGAQKGNLNLSDC